MCSMRFKKIAAHNKWSEIRKHKLTHSYYINTYISFLHHLTVYIHLIRERDNIILPNGSLHETGATHTVNIASMKRVFTCTYAPHTHSALCRTFIAAGQHHKFKKGSLTWCLVSVLCTIVHVIRQKTQNTLHMDATMHTGSKGKIVFRGRSFIAQEN